jgi:hypothetical protein
MRNKLIIWIIAMLLLVSIVTALGVTPSKKIIGFEPGLEESGLLKIINSGQKDVSISIVVRGELAEYIELNESKFEFSASDSDRFISYIVRLPGGFESYGQKIAEILVNELPKDLNGELVIGALVTVVSEVHVDIPYPEKHAEAELNVLIDQADVSLHTVLKNLGEDRLENVKATMIVEKDGEEIFRKETLMSSVNKFERTEALEIVKLDKGDYLAKALVDYDGEIIELEKEFTIGELVSALGISVNEQFNIGDVAKLSVLIENGHVIYIEDIIAELVLKDSNGNLVAKEISRTFSLGASGQDLVDVFWDTKGISVGSYTGTLILKYNGKAVEKPVSINLYANRIEASFSGITGFAIANEQPVKTDRVVLIPILIGIIIVMAISMVVMRRKKRRGPIIVQEVRN